MRAVTDKETNKEVKERALLGDLLLEYDQKEVIDRATEEEKDQALFDSYITKGLVNIKNLVLKNPEQRSSKEVEFLILYLKHQFSVFYEIEKGALEMFVARLSFALYKQGEVVARTGQPCTNLIMFIDGQVDALSVLPPDASKMGYVERLTSETHSINASGQNQKQDGYI